MEYRGKFYHMPEAPASQHISALSSGEERAVPIRQPSYAQLLVDSLDRYSSGKARGAAFSSSDWTTRLKQIVLNGYFTRLAVTQVQFQWNLPTIIQGYNDTFVFAYQNPPGAVNLGQVTIPENYYTPDELAAEIQAQMVAISAVPGFQVAFTQGCFTINCATPGWTFALQGPNPVQDASNRFYRTYQTLGFLNLPYGDFNPTTTGSPPSMLPTRFIDICSSTLTKFQRVKDTTTLDNPTISNVIARIYPTPPNTSFQTTGNWTTATTELPGNSQGSHPFNICIDYNTPKFIKWDPSEALNNFDLQLRDDFGEFIPWNPQAGGPACEYQLTILASET